MGNEIIYLSAEDRYSLIDMSSQEKLFPHPFTLGNFGKAMEDLRAHWEFLWDFRWNDQIIYNDVRDAYEEAQVGGIKPIILARPEQYAEVRHSVAHEAAQVIKMKPKILPKHSFDLSMFEDETSLAIALTDEMLDVVAPRFHELDYQESCNSLGLSECEGEISEYTDNFLNDYNNSDPEEMFSLDDEQELHWKIIEQERARTLRRFLDSIGMNSLLAELAIVFDRERVKVIPYHSFSLHNVSTTDDQLILLRPGRRSADHWRRFKKDIRDLEALLNDPNVKEHDIEMLLRRNPLFLRGLNYRKVYPQVILPLGEGDSLRPDAIAEPIGSEWCNVIDYKLPSQRVLVGRDNRLSLAAGITEVAAQLREYSAYFDDRTIAKIVEEKYGFKCYKPKLVAIVGRDPQDLQPEQVRRAMTAFPDLEVVTYDGLLRAAKRSLLL